MEDDTGQYLPQGTCEDLLAQALPGAMERRLCRNHRARDACGAAVAALIAQSVDKAITRVHNVLDARSGDILVEDTLIPEKFKGHFLQMKVAAGMLAALRLHLSSESYRLLPGADDVLVRVETALYTLNREVLPRLKQLADPSEPGVDMRSLKNEAAAWAIRVRMGEGALESAMQRAALVSTKLEKCWDEFLRDIESDENCR